MNKLQWTPYNGDVLEYGYYICTIEDPSGWRWVAEYIHDSGNFYWPETDELMAKGRRVVATMPIPDPYRG